MYFPQSLSEARATFLINLAGVYSLRSEFDKARKCLQQVGSCNSVVLLWDANEGINQRVNEKRSYHTSHGSWEWHASIQEMQTLIFIFKYLKIHLQVT